MTKPVVLIFHSDDDILLARQNIDQTPCFFTIHSTWLTWS